jgi:hypothetical protein
MILYVECTCGKRLEQQALTTMRGIRFCQTKLGKLIVHPCQQCTERYRAVSRTYSGRELIKRDLENVKERLDILEDRMKD